MRHKTCVILGLIQRDTACGKGRTAGGLARTVPLTDALVQMLKPIKPKEGIVFDDTNLRKAWQKACVAAGLGSWIKVDGVPDKRYTGLIIHDLRRSAIRNLVNAGVNEKVAMEISGHKTRDVFDRYHIVDAADVLEAMQKVQNSEKSIPENGESLVRVVPISGSKRR